MAVVLGIDAAWTPEGSSGIALLRSANGRTEIVASAPSYESFVAWEPDRPVVWKKTVGTLVDVPALLRAAERFAGSPVDLAAVDMPLSRHDITKRRFADDELSRAFGAAGAGVHSPSEERPGRVGSAMTRGFAEAGYTLATSRADLAQRALVEVFPLAALVRLMDVKRRPAYKVGKIAKSWRHAPPETRLDEVLNVWTTIVSALGKHIDDIDGAFSVPRRSTVQTAAELKPREDVLDAIVCAWIGLCVFDGRAQPFGDAAAAIWIPDAVGAGTCAPAPEASVRE